MANLFDTDNVPTTEPAKIVAGDLLQWKRTDLGTDYANGSYTLSYKARLEGTSAGSSVVITITASASGDDYLREVHRERALNGTATGTTVVARF